VESCANVSRIAPPVMPSDPYQSQVFRKLLRQTRQWLDRRQQTVRQLQVAASWSAQILIYPAYALFQSARSLSKTLGKAIQPNPSLLLDEHLDEVEIPLQSAPLRLTAETALQQILQTVESFSLPERLPIGLEPQTTRIRAIACLVETQALVLVTQFNQILDVLNPHQQDELAQRISWEMAAYARSRRSKSLPDRIIDALQGARLVKRSRSVSEGESLRELRLFARFRPVATNALPAASGSLCIDTPIRQSMLAVRDCLTEVDVSSHMPLLTAATSLSAPASIFIRGVATQLEMRSLVLVTNRNEILDILDADQQLILQQRIIWEVAHYRRYLRLRHAMAQLDPVRSPHVNSPVFPGVRSFYQLMVWMQQGSVAIATNLFKEADLADRSPAIVPAPQISTQRDRGIAALIPVIRRPERSLNAELTISEEILSENIAQSMLNMARSPDIVMIPDSPIPEIIDTEVTLMGYELSLLERIMRLLDFCFFAIEEFTRLLWNGLLKLVPKRY